MRRKMFSTIVAMTAAFVVLLQASAIADQVRAEVVAEGGTTIDVDETATVDYFIQQTGPACDPAQGAPAIVTLTVPSGLSADRTSLTFTNCGSPSDDLHRQAVIFTGVSAGPHTVTATVSDADNPADSYTTTNAVVTITVNDTNTAPSVAVTGVTDGASYEHGSVPAAGCQVTDAQDGNSTSAATLSAITGPLSSYGLGSQTASCSYTDDGGLSANASATYSIVDTAAPVLTVPGDAFEEAVSASGAAVTYGASATDAVDPAPVVSCAPVSGSTFPMGTTTVSCTATDAAGNSANDSFDVTVQDTTAPLLSLPSTITEEASGPAGAVATFTATATDAVDPSPDVSCIPASGSTFPLGTTTVTCSAVDDDGNDSSGSFDVVVRDTTPPTLTLPSNITVEATGPSGATVNYVASASDIVDTDVAAICTPASGSTFALGTTTVNCSATDDSGNIANGSFTVTVQDTTPPTLTLPSNITVEATGPSGAAVNYVASASDLVDTDVAAICTPASGSTFALGTTTVNCSATDDSGNIANGSFTVAVQDTTAPVLSGVPGNISVLATGLTGAVVPYTDPTATDVVDPAPVVGCVPASGSTFAPGTTSVTCTASDFSGNSSSASFTVTVSFAVGGFYAPIDRGVHNTVKGGATVPLKFNVYGAGGVVISNAGVVEYFKAHGLNCTAGTATDEVEATSTGGTSLRWDSTGQQFIQNWQTPKKPSTCWRATVQLLGGQTITADFKLK